jgi:2-oxoglutarate dehydrogenase complex dehydrogenase (E1) component-like enzyme
MAMMGFRCSRTLSKPAGVTQSYNDQMYQQWRENPDSVDQTWAEHFGGTPKQSSGGDPQLVELLEALKSGGLKGTSSVDINQA